MLTNADVIELFEHTPTRVLEELVVCSCGGTEFQVAFLHNFVWLRCADCTKLVQHSYAARPLL